MATITRDDIDQLNVNLTVNVQKEDYLADFQKELKRYRSQAQLKGFRKGKTPMSVVLKMYGRNILADIVNRQLQDELSKFLFDEEKKIDFLGQPIPAEDQEEIDFNATAPTDYIFKFDLGLAPQFEVQGVEDQHTFEQLVVTPSDTLLDEELQNLRKRFGESAEVDEPVAEKDIITLQGIELEDGAPKPGGIEKEFTLFIENITDTAREAFLGKEKGAQAVLNVFELEAKTSASHVRKYLLGLDEEDDREISDTFELTIGKISRHTPAEMDEAFFAQAFGEGDVTTAEEAKAKIKADYQQYFAKQADALLFRDFQEYLMAQNPMDFPEDFLKRWLLISNEKNTKAAIEQGFEGFKKGLQWTMLREKLIKHFELDITADELRAHFTEQVRGYFGGGAPDWLTPEMLDGMVDRMMKEEKTVKEKFDELMNEKISQALHAGYNLVPKTVDPEAFQAIITAAQAQAQAESALLDEEEDEEEE